MTEEQLQELLKEMFERQNEIEVPRIDKTQRIFDLERQLEEARKNWDEVSVENGILNTELTSLRAELEACREGLRKLEWSKLGYHDGKLISHMIYTDQEDISIRHNQNLPEKYCTECGNCICMGHKPDCWLAKLLKPSEEGG